MGTLRVPRTQVQERKEPAGERKIGEKNRKIQWPRSQGVNVPGRRGDPAAQTAGGSGGIRDTVGVMSLARAVSLESRRQKLD